MCSSPHSGESCANDSHVDVECTIVRPSVTGLWVASVREARPLESDRGQCRHGLYKKQKSISETMSKPDANVVTFT